MRHHEFPIVIDGVGAVWVEIEVYEEDGQRICGITDLRGEINLPPKKWLQVVRDQLRQIEQFAKDSGVTEMRFGGRRWGHIFPDYEPFEDIENGLRKRL